MGAHRGINVVEAFGGMDGRLRPAGGRLEPGADRSSGPLAVPARAPFSRPRLTRLAGVDELLDALGPAQAGYGGAGLIP